MLKGLSPGGWGPVTRRGDPTLEEVTGEKGDRMGVALGSMWVQCFVGLGLGKIGNFHLKLLGFFVELRKRSSIENYELGREFWF